MRARRLVPLLLALAAGLACAEEGAARGVLRVCADPDNLPYSRADGAGFEDHLARLLARELDMDLQYAWLPDRRGFVRKTLGAGLCDVVLGVPVGMERLQLTQPYYRSSYVWVQRADAGPLPTGFDDPRLARLRIGVQLVADDLATSPPGYALARRVPRAQVVGFPIPGEQPAAERMVRAIAEGRIDGAFIWGPQAGYFAQHAGVPMRIVRLAPPPELPREQPFDFAIAVGVRRGDQALRQRLQQALQARHADIAALLAQYGVPLTQGQP